MAPLLLLVGGFAVAFAFSSTDEIFESQWAATGALVVGIGVAAAVGGTRPRALPLLGAAAGIVAFAAAWQLGSWDVDGVYDSMVETTKGKAILAAVGVGGLWSLALGIATTVTARGWRGRAAGLLVALFGTFWLTASAF